MRRGLAALLMAGGLGGGVAQAADGAREFAIPRQPREEALMALAAQAGLSIGFAPGARCAGEAAFRGRASLDQAVDALLAGSDCEAARPDGRTLVIRPRRSPSGGSPRPPPAAPTPSPETLAELVVTAEKRETLASSTASGLSAIGAAELERAGVEDVSGLSLLAAGVTVTNLGPGRDKILLRGLSDGPLTGHTQSTVGIYLGELRLTYNAPDPDLPYVDVARLEVLRGPQGSLYGSGSVGGVVHVVPNAPDPVGRSGRVAISAGSISHGDATGSAELTLNQPLSTDAAVRLAAWTERSGGYIDDALRGRSNVDRTRRRGARLSGAWRPSDDLAVEAMVVEQTIDTRDAHYAEPQIDGLARATPTAEPHDNDFLAGAITLHWTPAWARLSTTVGALDHDVVSHYDASRAPAELFPPGARPVSFEDENEIRGLVTETRLTSARPRRLQWVAGVFAAFGQQRLDQTLDTDGGGAGYLERRRDRLYEGALFGEAAYELTPNLTLTLGGRLFDSRLRTGSQVSVASPARVFRGDVRDGGAAPKLRLAWAPRPRLTLYVLAAEGYRTAGFNTGGPVGQAFGASGSPQPLRRYAGDELWNYEAGARWRTEDGRLSIRAAAFQADWRNIQAILLLPSGIPYTANLGDGRSRGVEIEAAVQRGQLRLFGNLVAQDTELRRPALGLPLRADQDLPGMPSLTYALGGEFAQALPLGQLRLTADYAHVGDSRLALDPADDPRMGDYGNLRLGVEWRLKSWGVALSAENVLDGHGDTLAFGNPFAFRARPETTPQQPRTVRFRVTRDW